MVSEGTVGQVVIGVWSYMQTYDSEHPKGLYSVSDRETNLIDVMLSKTSPFI